MEYDLAIDVLPEEAQTSEAVHPKTHGLSFGESGF